MAIVTVMYRVFSDDCLFEISEECLFVMEGMMSVVDVVGFRYEGMDRGGDGTELEKKED